MKRMLLAVLSVVLIATACGGSGGEDAGRLFEAAREAASNAESDTAETATFQTPVAVTPEGSGDLPMNSIRIGDRVWMRTLPMTTGQCFVTDENASGNGLPASTNVWGTLDGDDETKFSVSMNQQGEFQALVDDQQTFHWLAGTRASEQSEITFTFDYDNDIARGTGIFWNAFTSERAHGSFVFQCEPA